MKENTQKIVVVLGMHRSGTSAITRGLQALGVELGERFLPTMKEVNGKGFWEDLDFNAFDEEMLDAINSSWFQLAPIEASDVEILRKKGFHTGAVELLRKKVSSTTIFGFKDPRIARLLPFWKEVFDSAQFDVRYVIAIRNPLSVANSLAKRDSFEAEQSYLMWLGHVISSLLGSANHKRVLVDYDCLLQSPSCELSRIAKKLDLEIDNTATAHYISEFLDLGLRHAAFSLHDLQLEGSCPPLAQEIYAGLLDMAQDKVELDDVAQIRKIESWSSEYERLKPSLVLVDKIAAQKKAIIQTVAEKDEQIGAYHLAMLGRDERITILNQTIEQREKEIGAYHVAVIGRDEQVATLIQTVEQQEKKIEDYLRFVQERDGQIAALHSEIATLNIAITERDNEISKIVTSPSWLITAPLRAAIKFVFGRN